MKSAAQAACLPVLICLSALALLLLSLPVARSFFAPEVDYSEGWNVMRQHMAAQGIPLYRHVPGYAITNYLPLSFHLIGFLGKAIGGFNAAGRIVSLLCLVLVCAILARITFDLTRKRAAAMYAVLAFLCWVVLAGEKHVILNTPDFLALFFEMAGFYIFYIGKFESKQYIIYSALLFAFGFFAKPTTIFIAASCALYLIYARNWLNFILFVMSGIIICVILYFFTIYLDSVHAIAHILRPRPYYVMAMLISNVLFFLCAIPGCVLAVKYTKFPDRQKKLLFLTVLIVSHIMSSILCGGDGVADNIYFESLSIDAIIIGIAFGGALESVSAVPIMWFLAPVLWPFFVVQVGTLQLQHEISKWHGRSAEAAAYAQADLLLRGVHGPVVCEDLLLCYRAGKPSRLDPYFVKDQIQVGRIPEAPVDAMLRARIFGAVEIGAPNDRHWPFVKLPDRFCAGFMQTLFAYYRPVLHTPWVTIFEPVASNAIPPAPPPPVPCEPPHSRAAPITANPSASPARSAS